MVCLDPAELKGLIRAGHRGAWSENDQESQNGDGDGEGQQEGGVGYGPSDCGDSVSEGVFRVAHTIDVCGWLDFLHPGAHSHRQPMRQPERPQKMHAAQRGRPRQSVRSHPLGLVSFSMRRLSRRLLAGWRGGYTSSMRRVPSRVPVAATVTGRRRVEAGRPAGREH